MTDSEYKELLVALSKKYLRTRMPGNEMEESRQHVDRLMSTSSHLHAVHDRAEKGDFYQVYGQQLNIYQALGNEIQHNATPSARYLSNNTLYNSGILQALDDSPQLVLANLRRSAIPPEDLDVLRGCGIEDPEAEITLLIHAARAQAAYSTTYKPSQALEESIKLILNAGDNMEQGVQNDRTKKRKILNGVGNLLTGFVAGGANALLFAGTIAAPNPATAFPAIGSAAMALGAIFKGIGDLRGE